MRKIISVLRISSLVLLCASFSVLTGCEKRPVPSENEELGWAVKLKLKPQEDESYLATNDPEIRALVSKHDVTLRQTYQGFKTPELLLYYVLEGKGCNKENAIKDFLATGKFEDEVYEYGISYTAN